MLPVVVAVFQVAVGGIERSAFVSRCFHTNEWSELMLAYVEVVGGSVGPGGGEAVAHALRGACLGFVVREVA